MNELQVFNNPELIKDISLKEQFQLFGEIAFLLGAAADEDDKETALELAREASKIGHQLDSEYFNALYDAVCSYITIRMCENEFTYQEIFKKYASRLIKDCKVIKIKNDKKNIPDAWITIRGILCPVEMKYGDFNAKAKMQLMRYMNVYDTKIGLAIGRKLTVDLPANIEFIPLTELTAFK